MRRAVLAACALLLPAAAAAQDAQPPIEEIAADLAYGYCPLYLAEQFPLADNPKLTGFGFGAVTTQQDPRYGAVTTVSAKSADGDLVFGGAPGKTCTIAATGRKRDAVIAKLRQSMSYMGLDFKPVPNVTAGVPGFTVETFKAPVEAQFLFVQLIQGTTPVPTVSAQLFVTDK